MITISENRLNIYYFNAEFARPRANGSRGNRHVGVPNTAVGAMQWGITSSQRNTSSPIALPMNPNTHHPIQRGRGNRRQDNNFGACITRLHRPYNN